MGSARQVGQEALHAHCAATACEALNVNCSVVAEETAAVSGCCCCCVVDTDAADSSSCPSLRAARRVARTLISETDTSQRHVHPFPVGLGTQCTREEGGEDSVSDNDDEDVDDSDGTSGAGTEQQHEDSPVFGHGFFVFAGVSFEVVVSWRGGIWSSPCQFASCFAIGASGCGCGCC